MISKQVMKVYQMHDAICYRVACDCGRPECDAVIEIEYDTRLNVISMILYKQMTITGIWGDEHWLKNVWRRLKIAVTVLVTGYFETEGSMVFLDSKHLQVFMNAIKEGISEMRKGRV